MSEEKRMAGDYEIIQAVHIGDREIVVGENQADEQGLPYLVAYVDIFMYESEAVEMIWQLLFAAADADMAVNDYHSRLQRGGIR